MYANQTAVKWVSVMDYYSFIYIMIRLMYFFLTKTHQAQSSQMQLLQRIMPDRKRWQTGTTARQVGTFVRRWASRDVGEVHPEA